DRDLWCPTAVRRGEFSPADELHAEGREVIRTDRVEAGVRVDVRSRLEALHLDVVPPVVTGDQGHEGRGHGGHTGNRAEGLLDARIVLQRPGAVVSGLLRRQSEGDDAVDVHTQI